MKFPVKIKFSRPCPEDYAPNVQFFARVPVRGDTIVVMGRDKQDGDQHMTVSDVLLLPLTSDPAFPVAEVRVLVPRKHP